MSDETEKRWSATEKLDELFCPVCDEVAKGQVDLAGLGDVEGSTEPRYFCECGNQWSAGDFDNCAKCGKPLGGSSIRCHSCLVALTDGGASDE